MSEEREDLIEFSRPVAPATVARRPREEVIAASAAERRAIAERLDILEITELQARLRLRRRGRDEILVEGTWEAEVVQACVVSLAPVTSRLGGRLSWRFTTSPEPEVGEVEIDLEAEEPPEFVGPAGPDLGEALVQELAVSLDPYPRHPDVPRESPLSEERGEDEAATRHPFAVLKDFKPKD
jgi:uncharacterized metal-binding protein YceD (DUF177 family)